jgi:ferredoxin--NADP+ reductase
MNRTVSRADEVSPAATPGGGAASGTIIKRSFCRYVIGWIERGPSGVIGINKQCARETVGVLLDDWAAGRLPQPDPNLPDVTERLPRAVDLRAWKAIDEYELRTGRATLPRAKLVERGKLLAIVLKAMG